GGDKVIRGTRTPRGSAAEVVSVTSVKKAGRGGPPASSRGQEANSVLGGGDGGAGALGKQHGYPIAYLSDGSSAFNSSGHDVAVATKLNSFSSVPMAFSSAAAVASGTGTGRGREAKVSRQMSRHSSESPSKRLSRLDSAGVGVVGGARADGGESTDSSSSSGGSRSSNSSGTSGTSRSSFVTTTSVSTAATSVSAVNTKRIVLDLGDPAAAAAAAAAAIRGGKAGGVVVGAGAGANMVPMSPASSFQGANFPFALTPGGDVGGGDGKGSVAPPSPTSSQASSSFATSMRTRSRRRRRGEASGKGTRPERESSLNGRQGNRG
ncbi:unnamed protein product, partial [Laminaria digitata]